jgi:hypothetical protein
LPSAARLPLIIGTGNAATPLMMAVSRLPWSLSVSALSMPA